MVLKAHCSSNGCVHTYLMENNENYRFLWSDIDHKKNRAMAAYIFEKAARKGVPVDIKEHVIDCPVCGWALFYEYPK